MTFPDNTSSRFFRQLGKTELEGAPAFLDAQQAHLRENNLCGFIELQLSKSAQVIILFAQGAFAGAYLLEEFHSEPFQLLNLAAVWDGRPVPVRTVELPQSAGRAMWLALESQVSESLEIPGRGELEKLQNTWAASRFSGMVEILSEKTQDIFCLHAGAVLDSEAFHYSGAGFENTPAYFQMQAHDPLRVIAYKLSLSSQSYQCLMMRQGAVRWGSGTLRRYQELAGQKLVRLAQKDIEQIVQPWGWRLFIENAALRDEHFFAYVHTAAQAYRAVFMEIGSQMEQVIGSALTRRILNETFAALHEDTRAALELQRLIPAAFSE